VDNAPYFPKATIRCAAADLDYFLGGPQEDWFSAKVFQAPLVPDRLQPILDRIETWETDSTLFEGIDVRLTPGHTPGSSVVVVSSGLDRAMLLGDIVHCPLELQDDDFNFLGDHDQVLANRVREAYARELEGSGIPAAAAHFPGLRFGRLLPGQGVRSWTFDRD
jgi:glyoxylase-like metal-dependent hydrolase (beta-lactamase superfamily II)